MIGYTPEEKVNILQGLLEDILIEEPEKKPLTLTKEEQEFKRRAKFILKHFEKWHQEPTSTFSDYLRKEGL